VFGQFDAFVRQEVPKIEASPAFGPRGLILITYDEWGDATPHNHRVPSLRLAPRSSPASTTAAATPTTACSAPWKRASGSARTSVARPRGPRFPSQITGKQRCCTSPPTYSSWVNQVEFWQAGVAAGMLLDQVARR
jgi:hypothetical protein